MSKKKQIKQETIWQKTRPIQIAVIVIAVVAGSLFLFNREDGNATNNNNARTALTSNDVSSDANSSVVKLSDAKFQETIAEGVVLVDFWATWCAPCRIQGPIVEEVATQMDQKAVIAKLDVDQNPQSAASMGIRSIPTLIIFKDGEPVQKFVGVQQKETLLAAIESHL